MNAPDRPKGEGSRSPRGSAEKAQPIAIVLSDAQVQEVLRRAAGEEGLRDWLLGTLDLQRLRGETPLSMRDPSPEDDPKLSQSLLRGLSILRALQPTGRERGLYELARELGLSSSTTHRYVATLREDGLVEQNPVTRAYRLAEGSPT